MELLVTLENKTLLKEYIEKSVDEIVVGLEGHIFSALHEFSLDEIKEISEEAHSNNVKVIVLMNRLYSQSDISQAENVLEEVLNVVDYVMFADPALLRKAQQFNKQSQLIYRPETLMTSSEDAKIWKGFGLHSVVIPSLLTKQEVIEISSSVKDTTVIIHGHTLMSVSKRKLLSAYQHVSKVDIGISSYSLALKEKTRDTLMPIHENAYSTMIYTDYIQESFQEMKEFMNGGVTYFEIDTPFMNEEMILETISLYRDILDQKEVDVDSYLNKFNKEQLLDGYYGQKTVK